MATTVDTLVVRIEADMKDMRRALRRVEGDVTKSTTKMSGAFKKLGGAMKLAVGAVIVRQGVIAGKALINLSSDIEEMQGKSKVVFGKFRDGVVKELTLFGDAVGRSSFELEGMASKVQDTFVPMGFARGEAAKLSVELTKLAVDTASFNNASDTDTINAFQSALVGNHETVRRFGVVITEATLNQELFAMGIEGGNKAATNAQKVQARLNLITEGVTDAHGDAARTAGSFANQTKALFAALTELAAGIMENVLPAATKIVFALTESAKAAKEFLINMGLISEAPELRVDRTIKKLKQLELNLSNAKNELKSMGTAIQNAPVLEQSLGSTFIGGANVGFPEAMSNRHIADQEKLIAQVREEKNLLLLRLKHSAEMLFSGEDSKGGKNTDSEERKKQLKDFDDLNRLTTANVALNQLQNIAKESGLDIDMERYHQAKDIFDLTQRFPELSAPELKRQLELLQTQRDQNKETANAILLDEKSHAKKIKNLEEIIKNREDAKNFLNPDKSEETRLDNLGKGLKSLFSTGAIEKPEMLEGLRQLREELDLLDPAFAKMQNRIQSTADAMTDSLTQMVMDGKINFQSMKDMFKDMVRQMIADALKAQVIKPLLGGIFGGIGGALGGSADGGGTNIGNAFLNVASGFKKGASGGQFHSGEPYLVGERGPELIVPSSAGTIMNNHNTRSAMGRGGGTVVNQTINVQSGVAQTVRAEMISLLPRFKQDTMNAVVDAKRRGGAFGQAFG